MEAMRESWTDDRLDDLSHRMDRGFERVDGDILELRREINARFDSMEDKIDRRFESIDVKFESIDRRFESLWRMMLWSYVTLIGPLLGLVITLVVTQA